MHTSSVINPYIFCYLLWLLGEAKSFTINIGFFFVVFILLFLFRAEITVFQSTAPCAQSPTVGLIDNSLCVLKTVVSHQA